MSNIILRDYQTAAISELVANMRAGVRRNIYVLPTGGGKTAVASYMLDSSSARGQVGWFTVHRRELAYQTSEAFARYGIQHGMVMSGEPMHPWHNVQIALIGSIKNRMQYLKAPNIIIPDEAHHARAKSWENLFSAYPQSWVVGLTATPERLDGRGLGQWFDRMVIGPSMRTLIDQGYLAEYRLFTPPPPDMSDVHTVAGEFNTKEARAALERSRIVGNAIEEYGRICPHARAIVRSIDIEFSEKVAERFRAAGYRAVHIDGMADRITRKQVFDDFRTGEIEVLCQVELAGEGVDIPGILCAIDLRPTKSLTMYLQFLGRALRMFEGKGKAILLDHVGNAERHGWPDDDREWSLADRKRKPVSAPIFSCKSCFAAFRVKHKICPECGAIMYDPQMMGGRAHPQQIEGTLHEQSREEHEAQQAIFKQRNARKRELRNLHTLEELKAYAKTKGYSARWAEHLMRARERTASKWRRGGYA